MGFDIENLLKKKILVLDGAMGTCIQSYKLKEEDYRGSYTCSCNQKGNNDILNLTNPEIIKEIHTKYLEAGADIIETNTFNSTRISQKDYSMQDKVYELNYNGAKLAKETAEIFTKSNPDKPRFVAGSIGPTNSTASISPDAENPGARNITFDELESSYEEQIKGLLDGGADLLFIETVFDALNCRAAIFAAESVFEEKNVRVPIFVSATIAGKSGRILSGQTLEAFAETIDTDDVIGIGLNCSFGAKDLVPHIKILSKIQSRFISFYPNAGLPNSFGGYDGNPQETADIMRKLALSGYVNIVGGCCGTNPEYIKCINDAVKGIKPRRVPKIEKETVFCGLEPLKIKKENNFVNIGERTNVSGSKKFARLIREKKYDEALSVAKQQIENGAQIIDINFDDALLDAKFEMDNFLKLIGSEPEIAKVPIMIDSSKFEVIEAGLKAIQGKAIVNSISLKEGEEEFIRKAKFIKKFGAGAVVMAFDETGQADTYDRKISVCKRAYDILTKKVKFPPENIIFDPNILAIATGIKEHDNYAVNYIKSVKWIKENLPYSKVSGGVSNLSFSFRGNNLIRKAMHSVFLYHAINAGMDMGIVNPGMIDLYDDIDKDLREKVENVILNKKPGAVDELLSFAESHKSLSKCEESKSDLEWRKKDSSERLKVDLVKGITEYLKDDVEDARLKYKNAVDVIEGPLMDGMNIVGKLFADGKMFLPQILKSARVMKQAVNILTPYIQKQKSLKNSKSAGKVVFATVKGDVHDIGKSIVSVVLSCNNFEVIDLGVMVPCEKILETARKEKADIILLSGLITPSLDEMINVAEEMQRQEFTIPLMVGGATTSKVHTALKIAPKYSDRVIHTSDASQAVSAAKKLTNPDTKEEYIKQVKEEYKEIRDKFENVHQEFVPIEEARKNKIKIDWKSADIKKPEFLGIKKIEKFPVSELRKYIDWTFFFTEWDIPMKYPDVLNDSKYGEQARKLYKEANELIDKCIKEDILCANGVFGIFPANSVNENIEVYYNGEVTAFNTGRQQRKTKENVYRSLSDYVAPKDSGISDYIGGFIVTAGLGVKEYSEKLKKNGDEYDAVMLGIVAHRLTEAFSELLHKEIRKKYWGYAPSENMRIDELFKGKYRGIRPGFGYSSLKNHSDTKKLFKLLDGEKATGVILTDNFMMDPAASECGLILANENAKYF